jgi:uncharacterized membrane protein
MKKARVEAFSDGVIAILITIMVLELGTPEGTSLEALRPLVPVLFTYVLSFVFLGIYWNNHHHLLHAADKINGAVLWANLHLLFWLSLVPFTTAWMGEHLGAPVPTAAYGVVMFLCGVAYLILQRTIVALQGPDSPLARALGKDVKGRMSAVLLAAAIPLAFVNQWISDAIYVTVALMWFVPDRRIESRLDIERV